MDTSDFSPVETQIEMPSFLHAQLTKLVEEDPTLDLNSLLLDAIACYLRDYQDRKAVIEAFDMHQARQRFEKLWRAA